MCCQQSLTLAAELNTLHVECHAWDSLGYAEHHVGNLAEGAACYQRAVSMFRQPATFLPKQIPSLTSATPSMPAASWSRPGTPASRPGRS